MVGGERRSDMDGQVGAKVFFLRVSKKTELKPTSEAQIIGTRCRDEKKGKQRDKKEDLVRGLSDRHFVHIQSRKMTPEPPSRGTSTPVTLGYTLTLSRAVGQ